MTTLWGGLTFAGSIQWLHVEDINALHLSQDFETLESGRLLEIGGDGPWRSTGANEIFFGLDFCILLSRQLLHSHCTPRVLTIHSKRKLNGSMKRAFKLLDLSGRCSWRSFGGISWCSRVSTEGASFSGGMLIKVGELVRRTKDVVKLRLMTGFTAARRAAATAERWRNMAASIGVGVGGGGRLWSQSYDDFLSLPRASAV